MPAVKIVIDPIIPKNPLGEYDKFVKDIKRYVRGPLKRRMVREFNKTTAGWTKKPRFDSKYNEPYGTRIQMYVYPAGRYTKNWQRVSGGTGPRVIRSSKGMMHFKPGYQARTSPGGRWGQTKRRFGPYRHAWQVGTVKPHRIEPRKFSAEVAKNIKDDINRDVMRIRNKAGNL